MKPVKRIFYCVLLCSVFFCSREASARPIRRPLLNAVSAVMVDANRGIVLFSKNPYLKLPPASTTKIMTAVVVLKRLPLNQRVVIGSRAVEAAPSNAGLTLNAAYTVQDLLVALLVSSSNDAAVALAEAVAGDEARFAALMNEKAKTLGMQDTFFLNATGLPSKTKRQQYSTAYDLTLLMRAAAKDRRIDEILGVTTAVIRGSDRRPIFIKSHNKMLWRAPGLVKGKTGWTFASRHTFVGTNYSADKRILFALLRSKEPWKDIERLATFGLLLTQKK